MTDTVKLNKHFTSVWFLKVGISGFCEKRFLQSFHNIHMQTPMLHICSTDIHLLSIPWYHKITPLAIETIYFTIESLATKEASEWKQQQKLKQVLENLIYDGKKRFSVSKYGLPHPFPKNYLQPSTKLSKILRPPSPLFVDVINEWPFIRHSDFLCSLVTVMRII